MTIEATLERIADSLEGIHRLLANGSTVAPAEDAPSESPAAPETPEPAAPVETETPAADDTGTATKEDVRDALKALQKLTDAATAKGILAEFNDGKAKTLSDLKESDYAGVLKKTKAEIAKHE